MGACESDRNIHVEENNMTETNDAKPAFPEDAVSPVFGPEAGQAEETKEENDNHITVMAMMTHANAEEENLENLYANENVFIDEQTGEKVKYFDTLEDAKRAAAEEDRYNYGVQENVADEVYVMEQATVAVPVSAGLEAPTQYVPDQYAPVEQPIQYSNEVVVEAEETVAVVDDQPVEAAEEESEPQKATKDKKKKKRRSWRSWM